MKVRIIAAGKVRPPFLRAAVDDYLARLTRYLDVDEVEVRPGQGGKAAQSMIKAIPDRYQLWVLDAEGRQPSSRELADWLRGRMDHGVKGIALVIGAAEGLPPEVRARADLVLSLSKLTLPHRLARVVLMEQLYRAMTIIRGEPYDK